MHTLYRASKFAAVSATCLSVLWGTAVALPSRADTYLEEAGTITPAEASYTFEGRRGETVTVTLESEEFDPVLSLFDSSGNEIATNDDFGGTLNSTIILALPADDSYTVIAQSYSGQGGDYSLMVRSSTYPYEVSYAEAQALAMGRRLPGGY
jgi:hypothetical protein